MTSKKYEVYVQLEFPGGSFTSMWIEVIATNLKEAKIKAAKAIGVNPRVRVVKEVTHEQ